jgi:hypothetical protein
MLTANPTTQSLVDDSQSSAAASKSQPRLRCADRQTLLPAMLLEDLLAPEHLARTVWEFVEGLDLRPLLETIRSVEGRPGRPAIDPQIVVALWLYATIEGIGSARAVAGYAPTTTASAGSVAGLRSTITPWLTFASRTLISWMSCSPTVWPP